MTDADSPTPHPIWWWLRTLTKVGCLGVILIALFIYWRRDDAVSVAQFFLGESIDNMVLQSAKEMGLSASETQRLLAPVASFSQRVREGKVDFPTLRLVSNAVLKSPFTRMIVFVSIEAKQIRNSSMTDAEKATAHLTIGRFMRGVADKQIKRETIREVMVPVCRSFDWGSKRRNILKPHPTVEDLRRWLVLMDQAATAHGVANNSIFDPANELRDAIELGLSRRRQMEDRLHPSSAIGSGAAPTAMSASAPGEASPK